VEREVYRIIERIFVFVLLLSSMTVVDALMRPAHTQGRDPDVISTSVPPLTVAIESGIYACGAFLVLMRWRRVVNAARTVWPLVALGLLAIVSTAWSDAPLLTVRRSVFLLGSTFIGIYLAERFSLEQLTRWLAQALCLLMMGSIFLYLVAPASAIDYTAYDGAWKGLTVHKNTFGGNMAIAVAVLLLVRFRHFRWLRYVFLLTAAILLLLSRSATSLVGCLLVVSMMPLWRLIRSHEKARRLGYAITMFATCAVIYFMWIDRGLLLRVLGRDFTLTGRTDLWHLVLSAIYAHPILGYGYGAFWSGMKGEVLNIYIASRWLPMSAHNGYLELLLSFGIVGVPLLLYFLARSLRTAKDYIGTNEDRLSLWPISYLVLFLFHNFFESHLLETRSLEFLILAMVVTSLAVRTSDRQPRPEHAGEYPVVDSRHPAFSPIVR
jgi:exopolysaccharide production protein ExoQ